MDAARDNMDQNRGEQTNVDSGGEHKVTGRKRGREKNSRKEQKERPKREGRKGKIEESENRNNSGTSQDESQEVGRGERVENTPD